MIGATAVEQDAAYAVRETGRLAFFASGQDVLRMSAAPHRRASSAWTAGHFVPSSTASGR